MGDGICDGINDNELCFYDLMDCCENNDNPLLCKAEIIDPVTGNEGSMFE